MGNTNLVILFVVIVCSAVTVQSRKRDQFRVVYEWNTFDFKWPNGTSREDAITAGNYIKENVIISGVKPWGDRLYLTLPRMKAGVPATLVWIPADPAPNATSPELEPFPSWEANTIGDCKSFQSVQSIEIDTNGTMWIIDNGRTSTINPINSTAQTCPPTLTLIDLNNTKNSIVRYTFPESVASNKSYLNDLVIDDTDAGYAYITDNSGSDPGIIVFNRKDSRSWKIREGNSMRASQNAKTFTLNGTTMGLYINVDGIAMGPRYQRPEGLVDRNVYFCPLASYKLYSMAASFMRNESMATLAPMLVSRYILDLGAKPSQTDGMIMDEEGFLFYGLLGNYSIAQWDSKKSFEAYQHIIAKDPNFIQWADRFAFDLEGNLFVVVNRLLNFVAGKVNSSEVNYRILKSHVGTRSYLYGPRQDSFKIPTNPTGVAAGVAPGVSVPVNVAKSTTSNKNTNGAAGLATSTTLPLIAFLFSFMFRQ